MVYRSAHAPTHITGPAQQVYTGYRWYSNLDYSKNY